MQREDVEALELLAIELQLNASTSLASGQRTFGLRAR